MSESLGETLAKARRSLGKSLAEAEAATRVRAKLLDALEKGDYDALPAPAYVRGYVISYAKFLELDPAPLLKLFTDETGHRTTRETMRLPEQVVPTREQNHAIPYGTVVIIVGVIALLALAVWGVGRFTDQPEQTAPLPTSPETTATTDPADETQTPAIITTDTPAVDETTSPAAGDPFVTRVEVAADGASWLRVTVDGLKAYEGVLTAGESKEWDVTDTVTIRIGQPSAVMITRDGQPVEIPTGETPEVTLSITDTEPQ